MSSGVAQQLRVAPCRTFASAACRAGSGCARVCSQGLGPCYARRVLPALSATIGRSCCSHMSSLTSSSAALPRCRSSSRFAAVEPSPSGVAVVQFEAGNLRISARCCFAAVAKRECRPGYPGRGVLSNACAYPAMFVIGSEPSAEGRSGRRPVIGSACSSDWRAWDRPGGRPPPCSRSTSVGSASRERAVDSTSGWWCYWSHRVGERVHGVRRRSRL